MAGGQCPTCWRYQQAQQAQRRQLKDDAAGASPDRPELPPADTLPTPAGGHRPQEAEQWSPDTVDAPSWASPAREMTVVVPDGMVAGQAMIVWADEVQVQVVIPPGVSGGQPLRVLIPPPGQMPSPGLSPIKPTEPEPEMDASVTPSNPIKRLFQKAGPRKKKKEQAALYGDFVTWTSFSDDIPKGSVGQVVLVKEDGRRRVHFLSGREFNIKPEELKLIPKGELTSAPASTAKPVETPSNLEGLKEQAAPLLAAEQIGMVKHSPEFYAKGGLPTLAPDEVAAVLAAKKTEHDPENPGYDPKNPATWQVGARYSKQFQPDPSKTSEEMSAALEKPV